MEGKQKKSPSRKSNADKRNSEKAGSPSSSQHQLQGSSRIIKDHCADWHNYIDKWNGMNDAGFDIINKIINLKLQATTEREGSSDTRPSMNEGADFMSEMHDGMPEGLETLCDKLTAIYESMTTLMTKMSAITKHFTGVNKLEQKTSLGAGPLFTSWSTDTFVQASQHLEDMYKQELDVKKVIVEDVAHHDNRDIMMMYASTWLHQPYIEDDSVVTLESMLVETGFR